MWGVLDSGPYAVTLCSRCPDRSCLPGLCFLSMLISAHLTPFLSSRSAWCPSDIWGTPLAFGVSCWHAGTCRTCEAEDILLQVLFLNKCSMPVYLLLQDRCVWQGWGWTWGTGPSVRLSLHSLLCFWILKHNWRFLKSASSKCLDFRFVLPVISKHRLPSPGSAFIAPWRHSKEYSQIAQDQILEPSVASCVSLDKLLNLSEHQFPYLYRRLSWGWVN